MGLDEVRRMERIQTTVFFMMDDRFPVLLNRFCPPKEVEHNFIPLFDNVLAWEEQGDD